MKSGVNIKTIIFIFLLLVLLVTVTPSGSNRSQVSDHVQWVSKSLMEMNKIKVGMTRADLEKVFVVDGGIYNRTHRTYVYRECPYFKVDFQFERPDENSRPDPNSPFPGSPSGYPTDKIVAISKPYVDYPFPD